MKVENFVVGIKHDTVFLCVFALMVNRHPLVSTSSLIFGK